MRRIASVLVAVATLLAASGAGALELNTATRAELEQLNGVGVTMADRILAERARAPFTGWGDLERRVKGMRGARVQRLQAQGATVNGARDAHADSRSERKR